MPSIIDEIIGKLRTNTVASALGVDPSTVSSWRSRGSIPGEYWLRLTTLACDLSEPEITLELLARLHTKRPADPVEAR